MGHKIILNKAAGGESLVADNSVYTFEYTPPHDQTPAQAGEQFAAIQKHLNKAVAIANGEPTE